MPNRILREGILTSERVNGLSCEAEVFYRRLMSAVDDYGRFYAHPALLRAALYPLRIGTVSEADLERLLAEAKQVGLVRLYEAGGKRYLEIQEFRQRLRSRESRFPGPADMGRSDDGHLSDICQTSARLGGGVVEVVFEDEGGGGAASGSDGGGECVGEKTPGAAPPLHVQLSLALRDKGVSITSAHPNAQAWAKQGVTIAQALEAVSIARLRKPEGKIAPNYLAPIIEEMLNPPAAAKREPAWWASDSATLARGAELGLKAKPGEAMGEYRARINAAVEKKKASP